MDALRHGNATDQALHSAVQIQTLCTLRELARSDTNEQMFIHRASILPALVALLQKKECTHKIFCCICELLCALVALPAYAPPLKRNGFVCAARAKPVSWQEEAACVQFLAMIGE